MTNECDCEYCMNEETNECRNNNSAHYDYEQEYQEGDY